MRGRTPGFYGAVERLVTRKLHVVMRKVEREHPEWDARTLYALRRRLVLRALEPYVIIKLQMRLKRRGGVV